MPPKRPPKIVWTSQIIFILNPNHQTPKTMDFKDHLISVAIALVVVAYVVSPVDIVPDLIVPFGTVDDGIIVLLGYLREILSKRNG